MKRRYGIMALLLALVVPGQALAVLVSLDISDTDITVGESFTVGVLVDGEGIGEELLAFGLDVVNSGSSLTYVGYSMGPGFSDFSDPFSPRNVSGAAFPGIPDDDVLLATLAFSAMATGTETISVIGLAKDFFGLFYELGAFDIDASTEVTVGAATVPEPSSFFMLAAGLLALFMIRARYRR